VDLLLTKVRVVTAVRFILIAVISTASICEGSSQSAAELLRNQPKITSYSDEQLSTKILGGWYERKLITFLPDGRWLLQKYEGAPIEAGHFSWSIRNGELIEIRDGRKYIGTITSINEAQLVVQMVEGGCAVYIRADFCLSRSDQFCAT
jgi:hypothetical protein